jgi:hypothetical protein
LRADKTSTILYLKEGRNLFFHSQTSTLSQKIKNSPIVLTMKLLIGSKKESNHLLNYLTKLSIGPKLFKILSKAYAYIKTISINFLFGLIMTIFTFQLKFLVRYVMKWLLFSILEKTL